MSEVIKLSSPATQEFWKIPVLFDDEQILALDKPPELLVSPDRDAPERPNLMTLLHRGIAAGAPWAKARQLTYLSICHRLDFETTGVLLLAKNKAMLIALADLFSSEKVSHRFAALVQGSVKEAHFEVKAKIGTHPAKSELMRVDEAEGKRASTEFSIRERFAGYTLLECRPLTARKHQIRIHARHAGYPVLGDKTYRSAPLWLSSLKKDFRLKEGKTERPLTSRVALHSERLEFHHPVTAQQIVISAPLPKEMQVALKYLRRYASRESTPG